MSRFRHLAGAAAIMAIAYIIVRISGDPAPTYMECLTVFLAAAIYLRDFD